MATWCAAGRRGRAPALQALRHAGLRSLAIVFMHGYRIRGTSGGGAHRARDRLHAGVGIAQVSPLMKLVARGDTTVVDAYLSPILRRYVDQVAASCPA
jgi:5-oxoprolinase (ATP-hydrolysing)